MSDIESKESATEVCDLCKEKNLTDRTQFSICTQCNKVYCLHFASTIDPKYCTSCLNDVVVTEETIKKTSEHYNENTDKVYRKVQSAKRITIGGLHWLFQARKIDTLSDLELELAIEYHMEYLNLLLREREERRVERAHRNKNVKINFSSVQVTESSTIEVKKTRVKKATKVDPAQQLAEALADLQKLGFSPEMIAKMAASGK